MNQTPRIQVIDFLRGLSCLGVLLYHVRVELWVGWWQITSYPQEYSSFAKATAWLSIPTPFLGYAILLFFLISGFCIHYPNTSGNTNPCWKTYFIRRFWRIYPAYFGALALTAGISFLCFKLWGDKTWDIERILRVASLSQNYPPGNGQFLSNPSLWTIPLELEFYILYPLAFCLFGKLRSSLLWILSLAASAASIYLNYHGYNWLSFTALFLWPSWLLGAWVSQLYGDQKLGSLKLHYQVPIMVLSLSFALLSRYQNWDSWLQYIIWTTFYLFFFIFCLSQVDLLNRIIGRRILSAISWIGKISFSLYLIHFPLFKLFGYLHRDLWGEKPANFLVPLLYLIPVIFLAWIFFSCVENPIHQWSKKKMNQF
jgi:peptidoglycan/LPS O-acetylase OafA/YrhL